MVVNFRKYTFAKVAVARFIGKFGLEPVIFYEQVNMGKTIIEKLEHVLDVGNAVVLLTKCIN
ncbi:TIR domain-containing protein [Paenibacillus cymbidii]|uniref:TIR domain-containing protein n=1 Tax=Paenibacillus cymbidii TaxID=1639034 RepID=UPI001A9A7267